MRTIKVALAEDNPRLARLLKESIAGFQNVELLSVSSNGKELLQEVSKNIPDLILMDINMPVMDGIEATKRVKHLFPDIRVIMLTVFDDSEHIFNSILVGATGYLLKDDKPERILNALEEAMEGGAPMSPVIASKSLQLIRKSKTTIAPAATDYDLSERELQILQGIAEGANYQQIADQLFISPKTVRKHIENIYKKLQVHNKVDAARVAREMKLG